MDTDITFGKLFELYYTKRVLVKSRCPENAHYFISKHGPTWGDVPVSSITTFAVQEWVDEYGQHSRSAANRAVNMMAAVINWGIRRGYYQGTNPCRGVDRFPMKSRKRFLMPEEMKPFRDALESVSESMRDFFWLCLFTGARKGNVMCMRWDELNFAMQIWQFEQKNGETQVQPLVPAALAILQRRRERYEGEWVFPGDGATGHMVNHRRAWDKILKKAGLANLTIHDLRRTVGSYMAAGGFNAFLIGETLGHKDQRSTAVYGRLHTAPVRKALESIQDVFLG